MDLTSGIFTAPRPGIYFFAFTGHAILPASSGQDNLGVYLYLNGGEIGASYVDQRKESTDQKTPRQMSPLTLQSTLNLKKGDQVWVEIGAQSTGAYLYDDYFYSTHFTGFMLQEEIVASL
jgi:hypothetical protein